MERFKLEVLPIDGTCAACVCAISGDDVYESPHGAYLSDEQAREAMSELDVSDADVLSEWTQIS